MRIILAAALVLATAFSAQAASAPSFSDMSQKQVQAFFANKTALNYDRHGNSVLYFRPNGTLYVGITGTNRVQKSKWGVIFADDRWRVCLDSATQRIGRFGSKITTSFCVEAGDFVRQSDDLQTGDLLKLSSGKLKIDLGTKKTTLAKLLGSKS